ncbi:hypothetical protein SAMN02745883_01749 [Caminicella sporogenes DSM 14501]|uniref:Uncharacterized protein n=1 Tax=Caminicella sporogenes DSM 14501 TaxID=1121266 RepID=A0A1M6RD90_9FIRM|nr:hypothetical protein [Caminicella sporogenes]RKD25198.1 hypothetical protein BET04_02980 [Caminicella sporogenes]SHK30396.1 hypothetical protein SAMN02745883_01749 [Caminicella sporogenes DSM 14501]
MQNLLNNYTDVKRVLWIEDFDGGKIFDQNDINQKLENYGMELAETTVITNFLDGLKYIDEYFGDFDLVVLDIDFRELGDKDECVDKLKDIICDIDSENYDKMRENGGYYIFIYLMNKCFPKERIAMLTGNETGYSEGKKIVEKLKRIISDKEVEVDYIIEQLEKDDEAFELLGDGINNIINIIESGDRAKAINELNRIIKLSNNNDINFEKNSNTANDWSNAFKAAKIVPPESFRKESIGSSENNRFRKWIKEKSTSYYQTRGIIIQMCNYWLKRINDDFESILLFNKVCKPDNRITKTDLEAMLHQIKINLPISEPEQKNKMLIYSQIVRIASLYFDVINVKHPKFYGNIKEKFDDNLTVKTKLTYFQIIKLLRNWSSHDKIEKPNDKEVLFSLVIVFRALFNIKENLILTYEEKIINFLKEINKNEKNITNHFREILIDSFIDLYDNENLRVKSTSVFDILEDIGINGKGNYNYLFRMLWHGICDHHLMKDKKSSKIGSMFMNVDISAINSSSNCDKFIYNLLCNIKNITFAELYKN